MAMPRNVTYINSVIKQLAKLLHQNKKMAQQGVRDEVIEALKVHIKNPTKIKNSRSKSASVVPSLRKTVKVHKSSYRRKLQSHKSVPFEDTDFKTNRSSLYRSTEKSKQKYDQLISKWLRVKDIKFEALKDDANKASLVVYGRKIGVQDFRQGTIGNCWFICSLACLVWRHSGHIGRIVLSKKVRPEGIYKVFFCLDGKWTAIEIDDFFPCDEWNRLVFSDTRRNQLFAPILEKALAKHHSCYKALSAGNVLEGFSNLTGMPVERVEIAIKDLKQSNLLLSKLFINLKRHKYMISANCSKNANGLDSEHAYAVLDIVNSSKQQAVLLWNPWGKQELTGTFKEKHELLEKKYSNIKLLPGMFWLQFGDFLNCYDQMDICKISSKWFSKRVEFTLPFNLNDQKNLTIFALECTKETQFYFTIYQKVNREIELSYQLDLSVVVFKRLRDGSLKFAGTSRVTESNVSSHGKRLGRGNYVVAVLGFNHWGQTSRLKESPKLIIAFHGSKKFWIKIITSDMHLIGDLLIELALAVGTRKTNDQQKWCQYVVSEKDFCSRISVIENNNAEQHLIAYFNTGASRNSFSMRSQKETNDIVPPNCRQLISLLSPECDKAEFNYVTTSNINLLPNNGNSSNRSKLNYHADVEQMSALFAPRRINRKLKVEKDRPKEPIKVKADCEDENTSRGWCTIS